MASTFAPVTNGGNVTSWLPMTLAAPAPTTCSSVTRDSGSFFYAFAGTECFPPEVSIWLNQGDGYASTITTVTSLGPIVCPGNFHTASSSSLNADSTYVFCCPNDYEHTTTTYHDQEGTYEMCARTLTSGTLKYKTESPSGVTAMVEATTIVQTGTMTIYAISITGVASASPAKKRLSSGAEIGLGAGVGILGLLLLSGAGFLLFYCCRRRKAKPKAPTRYSEHISLPDYHSTEQTSEIEGPQGPSWKGPGFRQTIFRRG